MVKNKMADKEGQVFKENRRYKRVPAPKEATALFKNKQGNLDRVLIRDLSLGGMLICGNGKEEDYPTDSVINNIYLTVTVGDLANARKFFIHLDKGKIVRSFIGENPHTMCYGLELFHSSSYSKEQLEGLIFKLTPDSQH